MSLAVHGVGLWSPGYARASAWLAGTSEPSGAPEAALVASRMKRATSVMCRAAVEVVSQAAADAAYRPGSVATVFGSSHGEIQIAIEQMRMMYEGDGQISPARFKNSVHNTAAGLFSISAENRGFTTAIAAGPHTFTMSLLEAGMLLETGEQEQVVVSISEEPLPAPVDRFHRQEPLAVAFALGRAPGGRYGAIRLPTRAEGTRPPIAPFADTHPAAPALRLLRGLGTRGRVALSEGWSVEVLR